MNTVTLRPLQVEYVNAAHAKVRAGFKRPCLVAPTGFGKRYIAVWWAKECELQQRRAMIATDRRVLVGQMRKELDNFAVNYGTIMADERTSFTAPVQVASIQTLHSRGWLENKHDLIWFNAGFIDECHKSQELYAALMRLYPVPWFGFTATPVGPQGTTIIKDDLFDCMIEVAKNSQLIAQGYLLPTKVIAPSEPDIKGIAINDGAEFNQAQLSKRVSKVTAFGNVFNEWSPYADRQTIIFAPGLAYCRSLEEEFNRREVPCRLIEADMPLKEREQVFEQFANRDVRILLSVDILKEGFDQPVASCAIDLQPNSQLRTYWQKVGRIKRPHDGQDHAVYIDMAGNCWRHLLHPDDDPAWDEVTGDKTTAQVYQKRYEEGKQRDPITCPKCKAQRKGGRKCPECNFEFDKPIKWIRMGNGKLKEVSAERIVKKAKNAQELVLSTWKNSLFCGLHAGLTFDQCRYVHFKKAGDWPPENLPCLPKFGSVDRKLRVRDMFDSKDIMREFGRKSA